MFIKYKISPDLHPLLHWRVPLKITSISINPERCWLACSGDSRIVENVFGA